MWHLFNEELHFGSCWHFSASVTGWRLTIKGLQINEAIFLLTQIRPSTEKWHQNQKTGLPLSLFGLRSTLKALNWRTTEMLLLWNSRNPTCLSNWTHLSLFVSWAVCSFTGSSGTAYLDRYLLPFIFYRMSEVVLCVVVSLSFCLYLKLKMTKRQMAAPVSMKVWTLTSRT